MSLSIIETPSIAVVFSFSGKPISS